jgi:glycine betaine catabolism A
MSATDSSARETGCCGPRRSAAVRSEPTGYNAGMATLPTDLDFNGLKDLVPGLPASHYFDPARHALEMRNIWQRHWVYAARAQELPDPRSFKTLAIGDQKILLVRDEAGSLRAFHNTCRHRGALLCTESAGSLRGGSIICPYHAWAYSLDGKLQRTTSKSIPLGFDPTQYSLYPISVREWRGFLFVSLAASPPELAAGFDAPLDRLDAWPLEDLRCGHVFSKVMHCNWKIFWENYNECLHCPGVHPQLSQLVPIYGRALLEERDDPHWRQHAANDDPKYKGGLRRGADTWSKDGKLIGQPFPSLSEPDRLAAHVYVTGLPSMFVVGHPDYVRVVRLLPLSPETTELRVEFLFSAQTLADPAFDLSQVVDFSGVVLREDAEVCELNQAGLHAAPHASGVLMPEEYVVRQFHDWLRAEVGE